MVSPTPRRHIHHAHYHDTYSHLLGGDSAGLAETDGEGSSDGTAAKTTLLTTSGQERNETNSGTATDIESTNTLGSVDLVSTDAQEINVHLCHIDGDLADSLGSIGMEEDLLGAAEGSDLLERLNNSDLVVDGHDRDQSGVGANGSLEVVHGDQAVLSDREVGDIEALIAQYTAGIQDTLVLLFENKWWVGPNPITVRDESEA